MTPLGFMTCRWAGHAGRTPPESHQTPCSPLEASPPVARRPATVVFLWCLGSHTQGHGLHALAVVPDGAFFLIARPRLGVAPSHLEALGSPLEAQAQATHILAWRLWAGAPWLPLTQVVHLLRKHLKHLAPHLKHLKLLAPLTGSPGSSHLKATRGWGAPAPPLAPQTGAPQPRGSDAALICTRGGPWLLT